MRGFGPSKPGSLLLDYSDRLMDNADKNGVEDHSVILKWLRRVALTLVAAFVIVYVADWAIYRLRGSPQGSVKVSRTLVVPLKGNKSEYDYLGTSDVPCSVSLFSQGGESPCWQLRRHPTQDTTI